MSNEQQENFEMQVQNAAKAFPYPPTPDIASTVRQSLRRRPSSLLIRVAQVAAAILLCFLILMSVPPIRAAVLDFIGAIIVYPYEKPTPLPPTATAMGTPLKSVLELPGETTLEAALEQITFNVILPEIHLPDKVFLFGEKRREMLVLVWLDKNGEVAFSLHHLRSNNLGGKYYPWNPEVLQIKGHRALWFEQSHLLDVFEPPEISRYIEGNVLLWDNRGVTYRLEGHLTKDEAIQMAETLIGD